MSKQLSESLINIQKMNVNIKNLFYELASLEIVGLKDSPYFQRILDYVDLTIEYRDELTRNTIFSPSDYGKLYEQMQKDALNVSSSKYYLFNCRYDNDSNDYMLDFLARKRNENIFSNYQSILEERDYPNTYPLNRIDYEMLRERLDVEYLIKINLLNTLIFYIDEFIKASPKNSSKEELIKLKYHLAFAYPEILYNQKKKNFSNSEPIFIDSLELYTQIIMTDEQKLDFSDLKKTILKEHLTNLIDLTIKGEEFVSKDTRYYLNICYLLIKSCVVNLPQIEQQKDFINKINLATYYKYGKDAHLKILSMFKEALNDYDNKFVRFARKAKPLTKKGNI